MNESGLTLSLLNQNAKYFEIETKQIQFWFDSLNDVKAQIRIVKESIESETKIYETFGKSIQTISKGFSNDISGYSEEPSNLNLIFKNIINLLDTIGKSFTEDILMLNVEVNKHYSNIINDIHLLKKSINETSAILMREIKEIKKKSETFHIKYSKLKSELDEAHTNKKKLENDPRSAYNVTIKDKAEIKILELIKDIQDLLPMIENCSKELQIKKESFNKSMKETFELVISSIFKNYVKIYQTLFIVSKEKFEIMTKLKTNAINTIRIIKNVDLQLNDFVERKFAEKKQIYFESIDSITINENSHDLNYLLKVSDSFIHYCNNFYNCMKLRKRSLQVFAKMIFDYSKTEEIISSNYSKVDKNIILNFNFSPIGSNRTFIIFKNSFELNFNLHNNFTKILGSNIYNLIINFAKETKTDYVNFNEIFVKKSKEILSNKNLLLKFISSKEKIHINIKEIRNNFNNNKIDQSKFENKMKLLSDEDNNLKKSYEDILKKIIINLNNNLEFFKKNIKILREKELKRLLTLSDTLESFIKNFDEIFDQNEEFSKTLMNISAGIDIYEDVKEIFEIYFDKFKIVKSEGFLEKIIRKVLKKSDFSDSGENLVMSMNNLLVSNQTNFRKLKDKNSLNDLSGNFNLQENISKRENKNNLINLKNFDSGNSNNYLYNIDISENVEVNLESPINKYSIKFDNEKYNYENNNLNIENYVTNSYDGDIIHRNQINNNLSENQDIILQEKHLKNIPDFTLRPSNTLNSVNSHNSEMDDKIDFINNSNFKIIESKNPYHNIKENELKEYLEKIKKSQKSLRNLNVMNNSNNINNNYNSSNNINNITNLNKNLPQENLEYFDSNSSQNNLSINTQILHENIFPLQKDESVLDNFSCAYSDKILLQGKLYITNKKIVFYSWFNNRTLFGTTKLVIPLTEITKLEKKYTLKLFDNSIKIITKKSELFFTSFVYRDSCFNLIHKNWEILKNEEEKIRNENNEDEEILLQDNMNLFNKNQPKNMTLFKSNYTNKILKKIEFFNRLEKINQERLKLYENTFRDENSFKKVYYKDESLGNFPLPLIYSFLFDRNMICEEFEKNKTFLESILILRNDSNINFENQDFPVPKFFEDLEYFSSIFTNLEEENLNQFLDEIKDWPKFQKFTYKFTHPIKKKLIGPEKISLKEDWTIYFISPKMMVVENIAYGSDFPYADTFNSITQYRFITNYKFSQNEGIFKFNTTCTLMFQVNFVKSCFFKGMIEDEGYKESLELLKLFYFEKIKIVLDNQSVMFMELFEKLNEENLRKTKNNFILDDINENNYQNDINNNEIENLEENLDKDSIDNDYDKIGWKIVKNYDIFYESNSGYFNNLFIGKLKLQNILLLSTLFILFYFIFSKINFNFNLDISLDKVFNIIIIASLVILFYRFNKLENHNRR